MTTDDRDGTLLPFPTVSLPPSFDASSAVLPPDADDSADSYDDPIPVGSWPMLPDVSDMAPPRHMGLAGVPEAEDDDEADEGAFVPPAPADPDNPRGRDAAVMGMAVLAAVGVACAQGMWQITQGVRARAEHRRAIADKARTAADAAAEKAAAKRVPPSPEYGRGQKGGGAGRSGSGSGGGGSGSGSKAPAAFRSNGAKKGPDGGSGSRSGGGGSKGPGDQHKGGQGPHKGAGGSGSGSKGPGGSGSGGGAKGPKGSNSGNSGGSKGSKDSKGNDSKSSKDGKSSKSSDTKSAKDTKAGKDSGGTSNKPKKLPEPVGPWKDKPENKSKPPKGKDTAGKDSPGKKTEPKSETKKADPKAEKVDLTKKPKADLGKEKGKAEKPPLYDKTRKAPSTHKPDGDGKWKKPPETPVNKTEKKDGGEKKAEAKPDGSTSASGKSGEDPGAKAGTAPPPGGGWEFGGPPPPPPGGMPGMDGMRPPPAYTEPEFKVWLERDDPPEPEPAPAGAITRGTPALPAGTAEEASAAASSTPPGPAAPAVPPQTRGARFVSAPVKADTQYRDAELTVYDVIDADADMAEEITAGVDEALAAADGCERLVTKLEALHAKVVELKVPGVLEGMVLRLIEKTGEVKARADAIAAALPRASEAIATAGDNTEAKHRHPADVTKDMGHTRPAERDYNME
ncbi:hypothetical protein GCM10010218_65690 [Streptomyces mashuensis]|uniref:Uncharacterized protein n=1 Tax=Streptomyces mashuensis TaxID=33904 RepID=A0A919BA81_9ACTN|nr:hypothetical protein [Streptomyces mashuensis]GHF75574.1 hypothetical protein GCM10010218_65690 [Streptomyces mashuensis]